MMNDERTREVGQTHCTGEVSEQNQNSGGEEMEGKGVWPRGTYFRAYSVARFATLGLGDVPSKAVENESQLLSLSPRNTRIEAGDTIPTVYVCTRNRHFPDNLRAIRMSNFDNL
jgi:hypothetical protein